MRGAKFQIKRFLDWSRKRWTEGAVLATEEIAPKLSSFPHYGRHCRSCVRDRGVTSALPFLLTWFPSKRAEHGHCVKNMSGVEVGVTVMAGPGGVGVSPGETGVAQRRLRLPQRGWSAYVRHAQRAYRKQSTSLNLFNVFGCKTWYIPNDL